MRASAALRSGFWATARSMASARLCVGEACALAAAARPSLGAPAKPRIRAASRQLPATDWRRLLMSAGAPAARRTGEGHSQRTWSRRSHKYQNLIIDSDLLAREAVRLPAGCSRPVAVSCPGSPDAGGRQDQAVPPCPASVRPNDDFPSASDAATRLPGRCRSRSADPAGASPTLPSAARSSSVRASMRPTTPDRHAAGPLKMKVRKQRDCLGA